MAHPGDSARTRDTFHSNGVCLPASPSSTPVAAPGLAFSNPRWPPVKHVGARIITSCRRAGTGSTATIVCVHLRPTTCDIGPPPHNFSSSHWAQYSLVASLWSITSHQGDGFSDSARHPLTTVSSGSVVCAAASSIGFQISETVLPALGVSTTPVTLVSSLRVYSMFHCCSPS